MTVAALCRVPRAKLRHKTARETCSELGQSLQVESVVPNGGNASAIYSFADGDAFGRGTCSSVHGAAASAAAIPRECISPISNGYDYTETALKSSVHRVVTES